MSEYKSISSEQLIAKYSQQLDEREGHARARGSRLLQFTNDERDLDIQIASLQRKKRELLETKSKTETQYEEGFKALDASIEQTKLQAAEAASREMIMHLDRLKLSRPITYINSKGFEIPALQVSPLPDPQR